MTSNIISNIIKSTCIQLTQTLIMNVVMNNLIPSLIRLFKYLNCFGLVKIFIYLLCTSVLLYIVFKLFKFLKKIISGSSSKSNKSSTLLFKKNKDSNEISSFESKSDDFNLEPKKIIHKSSSSSKIKNNFKDKKIKNLINCEPLLSSF
jgi:hypothetical protein